jgi:hypothetical protein
LPTAQKSAAKTAEREHSQNAAHEKLCLAQPQIRRLKKPRSRRHQAMVRKITASKAVSIGKDI